MYQLTISMVISAKLNKVLFQLIYDTIFQDYVRTLFIKW